MSAIDLKLNNRNKCYTELPSTITRESETKYDISLTCRLCLIQTNKLLSIYEKTLIQEKELSYSELINEFTLISENDKLPKTVCFECAEKLTNFYIFKKLCKTSERKLNEFLLNKDENIEIQNQFNIAEENVNIIIANEPVISQSLGNWKQISNEFENNCNKQEHSKTELPTNTKLKIAEKKTLIPSTSNEPKYNKYNKDVKFECFVEKNVEHYLRAHPHAKGYICQICDKSFIRYICKICGQFLSNPQRLKSHVNSHITRKENVQTNLQSGRELLGNSLSGTKPIKRPSVHLFHQNYT